LAKKIIPFVVLAFFLFAAIIALTDDSNASSAKLKEADMLRDFPFNSKFERKPLEWGSPAHWFRSNAGGLAIEEVATRLAALRNEYALAIGFPHQDELPEYLLSYFNEEEHNIEIRILYKNGEQIRTQWIFRDEKGTTRLNAVFLEPSEADAQEELQLEEVQLEEIAQEEIQQEEIQSEEAQHGEVKPGETLAEEEPAVDSDEVQEIAVANDADKKIDSAKQKTGFIEIFDEKSFLTCEYRFFEDGKISKTDYVFNDSLILNSTVSLSEDGGAEFKKEYADFYRYNRSASLRAVERKFYKDREISFLDEPVIITFPRRIRDTSKFGAFIGERLNSYPEFFGEIVVRADSKIVFETDDRGRILSQTLYDGKEEVVWVIRNTWQDNRIVSTSKTEGKTVLSAEYSYNSAGDRILERNLKNGVLERVVRTEGKTDTEELYLNNVLVLRAVWEDGRKISETRVRN